MRQEQAGCRKCPSGENAVKRGNMFFMRLPLLTTFIAAIVIATISSRPALAVPSQGWSLDQSGKVCGEQKVMIFPNAVRVNSKSTGLVFESRAPDWSVMIYNQKDKIYARVPLEKFLGGPIRITSEIEYWDLSSVMLDRRSERKVVECGYPAIQVRYMTEGRHHRARTAELTYLIDRTIPRQVGVLLSKVIMVPVTVEGVPVNFYGNVTEVKKSTPILRTSVVKRGKFTLSPIDTSGWRQVLTEHEVFSQPDLNKDVAEFLKEH